MPIFLQIVGAGINAIINNCLMQKGNLKTLGQRIKRLRKLRDLLQVDLAVRAGISTEYIGSIEQGLRYPSLRVLQKIAKILKVNVSDLL